MLELLTDYVEASKKTKSIMSEVMKAIGNEIINIYGTNWFENHRLVDIDVLEEEVRFVIDATDIIDNYSFKKHIDIPKTVIEGLEDNPDALLEYHHEMAMREREIKLQEEKEKKEKAKKEELDRALDLVDEAGYIVMGGP